MKKYLIPLVILLVLSFVMAGCGKAATSTTTTTTSTTAATTTTTSKTSTATTTPPSTGVFGGTLTILNALAPANNVGIPWDTNTQSWWAIEYLYAEPLIVYTRQGTVEPWLATSWTVDSTSANPSITFSLRKGVKFQDGTDFNADAVKWQLDKVISIAAANAGAWKSVDVVDPYTVKLNLKSFQNSIWQDLSGLNANSFFISPTQYKTKGEDYARQHPVGTGPFQVTSFSKDQYIKTARYDGYWGGKPYLDGVDLASRPGSCDPTGRNESWYRPGHAADGS